MTDHLQAARTLGSRYLLHESIGRGAMGEVFRATLRSGEPGAEFAAKVLRPEFSTDPEILARFLQERTILTTLQDVHLVRVHDLVLDGDALAIVMEHVRGSDLRRYLRARTLLPPAEAVDLVAQVLEGLAAAHDVGIIHRDVKPENVLLDVSGPGPLAKLADFGIARMAHGRTLTRMTNLIGSPEYMAPELAEHEHASPAVDLYAAGIVLYELLAGRTPFAGGHPVAVLRRHLDEAPPPIPDLDADLRGIIERLLAKRPQDRPASAHEMAEELRLLKPRFEGVPALPAMPAPTAADPAGNASTRLRSTPAAPPPVDPVDAPTNLRIAAPTGARRTGIRAHGRGSRRALALGSSIALFVVAAVAVAWAVRPALRMAEVSTAPVALSLAPSIVGDGVVEQRHWRLSDASSDNFTEEVTLSNSGTAPTEFSYDLVIPKEIAASASDVVFSPAPDSVVDDDPVVRYRVALAPGASLGLRYTTTVRWEGTATEALAAWETALRAAIASYRLSIDAAAQVTLAEVALKPRSITLDVGGDRLLALVGKMSDGTAADPSILAGSSWSSSAPGVADVDDSGRVTARRPGQATVTLSMGGLTAQSLVTVRAQRSPSARTATGPATSSSPTSRPASPKASTPRAKPTTASPTPRESSATPLPSSSSPRPAPTRKTGDINGDGVVDDADKDILLSDWQTSASRSDLNGDGIVDAFDLSILLSNWG